MALNQITMYAHYVKLYHLKNIEIDMEIKTVHYHAIFLVLTKPNM